MMDCKRALEETSGDLDAARTSFASVHGVGGQSGRAGDDGGPVGYILDGNVGSIRASAARPSRIEERRVPDLGAKGCAPSRRRPEAVESSRTSHPVIATLGENIVFVSLSASQC